MARGSTVGDAAAPYTALANGETTVAKKTFSFTPAQAREPGQVSQTGREVLRKTQDDGVMAMDNAKLVRVERLAPDPSQPRKSIDQQYLERLAESIRLYGVLMPITVKYRVEDETFLIIAGEQRWRAAQIAGLSEVPVVVRNSGTTDRYVQSCMENLVRADLTEVEKGQALEELKRLLPQTWEEMARMLGLTRRRVDQMRQLTTINPALREAVQTKAISGRHARQLDLLPEDLQAPALVAVVQAGMNVRQVEEVVRRLRAGPTGSDQFTPADQPDLEAEGGAAASVAGSGASPEGASIQAGPTAWEAAPSEERVAATIAAVLADEGGAARQRHSVPVARKLTMIEKALRGIPLHAVGDADRAEVIARLRRISEVLTQMERVLS